MCLFLSGPEKEKGPEEKERNKGLARSEGRGSERRKGPVRGPEKEKKGPEAK